LEIKSVKAESVASYSSRSATESPNKVQSFEHENASEIAQITWNFELDV